MQTYAIEIEMYDGSFVNYVGTYENANGLAVAMERKRGKVYGLSDVETGEAIVIRNDDVKTIRVEAITDDSALFPLDAETERYIGFFTEDDTDEEDE